MDAFRSELIIAKEEFDWPFKTKKEWELSRFVKLFLGSSFKEASADSAPARKKLNKNRNNKRIAKEIASIKRSTSKRCFHDINTRLKCEEIQKKRFK